MLFLSDKEIDNEDDRQDIFALLFLELFLLFIIITQKKETHVDVVVPTVEDETNSFLFFLSLSLSHSAFRPQKKRR